MYFIQSLPIQLVFHHIKKNLAILMLWAIIIGAFSGGIGKVYGIQYLFLDPEYLGNVGFWSFFITGFAFGNFVISFHITTYILDSHRFRFLGVLQRPFTKFAINNSLIPVSTLIGYLILIVKFQLNNEYASNLDLFVNILGFLIGLVGLHLIMILYFKFTNKDIFKFVTGSVDKKLKKSQLSRERIMNRLKENKEDRYHVKSYLNLKLKLRPTEKIVDFRNKEAILKVFDQNHFNSVIVELIFIGIILLLGFFLKTSFLQIPAAASCLLILSIAMMLVGAISFWFRGWGLAFATGVFIIVNLIVGSGLNKGINKATGLNYDTIKTEYSALKLNEIHSKEQYIHDQLHMMKTLDNWKNKWNDTLKRKMVFLCVSGGGQRAALWSVNALSKIDEQLENAILDHSFMITGASGGVIGAAYYRELFLRSKENNSIINREMALENMGKDNLNPVIFTLLVNDLFFKLQSYTYEGKKYNIDRGYIFEQNLNLNLGGILDKKVIDYQIHESKSEIPILIMSPTISNDGRKLYVSSQPMAYMAASSQILENKSTKARGVDFMTYFRANEAEDLHFLSALRMSASFPYITPNISLPSKPRIEIMDAGISDNYGITDAVRFINVFKKWIVENTDGIVLLVIRDTTSDSPIKNQPSPGILDRITYPIASVYNNLSTMQDVKNDVRIEHMKNWLETDLDVIEIAYDAYENPDIDESSRASLSWHLTTKEKMNLIENIEIESNKKAITELVELLHQ